MAFTGNDVKTMAEAIIDDELIETDAIQNLNQCLLDYADFFRKTSTQELTVTDADVWQDRTEGHLSILKVVDASGKDYIGQIELSYDRTQIRIPVVGTYTITSLVAPEAISSLDGAVAVHDLFKSGISQYVGALFKLKDNDQNPDGLKMEARASAMIKKASTLIGQGDRRQGQRVPIRR
jgi:hypothetical protein